MELRTVNRSVLGAGCALLGLIGLLASTGCAGSASGMVELAFSGICKDARGQGVPAFSLSVGPAAPSTPPPRAVAVTTNQGQYDARVPVKPLAGAGEGQLGPTTEKVTITVEAKGYKTKVFTVTADRLYVGKPNTMNITLEPSA